MNRVHDVVIMRCLLTSLVCFCYYQKHPNKMPFSFSIHVVDQMSMRQKYVLRKNRDAITEELDAHIVDRLVSSGVLTPALSDEVKGERTRRQKASKLLDKIEGRGSRAFPGLVNGLKETQNHLGEMLEKWTEEALKLGRHI